MRLRSDFSLHTCTADATNPVHVVHRFFRSGEEAPPDAHVSSLRSAAPARARAGARRVPVSDLRWPLGPVLYQSRGLRVVSLLADDHAADHPVGPERDQLPLLEP